MSAQEVELQRVAGVIGRTWRWFRLNPCFPQLSGVLRPGRVQKFPPGDGNQPPFRIPRRVAVPGSQGLDQRVLHGVLGRREVNSTTDEDAGDSRNELPQQRFVHSVTVGGAARNGRSSSHS